VIFKHHNNNNLTYIYCTLNMLCKLKCAGHCTSAKRMTSILRHVAEAFPPAIGRRVRLYILDNPKLPSSNRNCYQYFNGAKLCLSDLHNDDSRCRTARYNLTSYMTPRSPDQSIICICLLQDKPVRKMSVDQSTRDSTGHVNRLSSWGKPATGAHEVPLRENKIIKKRIRHVIQYWKQYQ